MFTGRRRRYLLYSDAKVLLRLPYVKDCERDDLKHQFELQAKQVRATLHALLAQHLIQEEAVGSRDDDKETKGRNAKRAQWGEAFQGKCYYIDPFRGGPTAKLAERLGSALDAVGAGRRRRWTPSAPGRTRWPGASGRPSRRCSTSSTGRCARPSRCTIGGPRRSSSAARCQEEQAPAGGRGRRNNKLEVRETNNFDPGLNPDFTA